MLRPDPLTVRRRAAAVAAAFCLCAALSAPATAAAENSPTKTSEDPSSPPASDVSDDTLARLILNASSMPPEASAHVEVYGDDLDAVATLVSGADGEVTGRVDGYFVEAVIPVQRLAEVYRSELTAEMYPLTRSAPAQAAFDIPTTSGALASVVRDTIKLAPWHEAGHRGEGQRIGIIDHFGSAELDRAIAANRLPTPAGTFCREAGRACVLPTANGGVHGVAVAEIIHAIVPDAELYFATVQSQSDTQEAVEWFAANGVTVINRSVLTELDGPGDGTGPMASISEAAVDRGMVWVLSLIHI